MTSSHKALYKVSVINLSSTQMLTRGVKVPPNSQQGSGPRGGTLSPSPAPPFSLHHEFFEPVTLSPCKCFHFLPSLEVFKCVLMVILSYIMSSHLSLLTEESASSPKNWTLREKC